MSSTSAVTSSAVPVPSGASCNNVWNTPNQDTVCAMPYSDDNINHMTDCCKGAQVVSYYDNCGLYCLVVDQTVDDVTKCLFGKKVAYNDVFCRGTGNDTATATEVKDIPQTASATVISSATSSSSSDSDDKNSDDKKNDKDSSASKSIFSVAGLLVGTLLMTTLTFGSL